MSEQDENALVAQRREKLAVLRKENTAFPNDFERKHMAFALLGEYADKPREFFETTEINVSVAGRLMAKRVMGKASFAHIQDMSGQLQLFVQKKALGDDAYSAFKSLDIGDIVGVNGSLFKTKTGELSIRVEKLRLLTKSLRPLPEKWHGLADTEQRYRQRYLDLIMNQKVRDTFKMRSKIVSCIRDFLTEDDFLEVETPMMQVIPGGAAVKPFVTHHNALDLPLYLRIAPELYLKRLVVGGFEKVFEINRNFRNEGLSTRHNPEFTMLEFYEAYADYHKLMDTTEKMFKCIAEDVLETTTFDSSGHSYDFSKPFTRMTVLEAITAHNPDIEVEQLNSIETAKVVAESLNVSVKPSWGLGKIQMEIFEESVEHKLLDPSFITAYPTEVSPLARRNDDNPFVTDRFELFIGGREIANGFSELNDAEDQAERFLAQVADRKEGDDEAMHFDADYINALEHGLPPTAGEGIGIDRLVMLFTDSPSIKDVLLFPHMKPVGN